MATLPRKIRSLTTHKDALLSQKEELSNFLSQLTEEEDLDEDEDRYVDDLVAEKAALIAKIQQSALKQEQIRQKRAAIQQKIRQLSEQQVTLNECVNGLLIKQLAVDESVQSVRREVARTSRQLQSFMQMNVINDAFYIWYNGPFGTINGFRLGRIPAMQVDWSEINAALGQAALLLTVIAEKAGFRFTKHILLPQGSFAKLGKADDRRTLYQLYTDGSFSLFPKRNFNHALIGFLACIQELGQKVVEQDPTLQLPYHIQDDKINDISITVSGADEDHWTRALKYMLTDIKWIVAWATKHLQGA